MSSSFKSSHSPPSLQSKLNDLKKTLNFFSSEFTHSSKTNPHFTPKQASFFDNQKNEALIHDDLRLASLPQHSKGNANFLEAFGGKGLYKNPQSKALMGEERVKLNHILQKYTDEACFDKEVGGNTLFGVNPVNRKSNDEVCLDEEGGESGLLQVGQALRKDKDESSCFDEGKGGGSTLFKNYIMSECLMKEEKGLDHLLCFNKKKACVEEREIDKSEGGKERREEEGERIKYEKKRREEEEGIEYLQQEREMRRMKEEEEIERKEKKGWRVDEGRRRKKKDDIGGYRGREQEEEEGGRRREEEEGGGRRREEERGGEEEEGGGRRREGGGWLLEEVERRKEEVKRRLEQLENGRRGLREEKRMTKERMISEFEVIKSGLESKLAELLKECDLLVLERFRVIDQCCKNMEKNKNGSESSLIKEKDGGGGSEKENIEGAWVGGEGVKQVVKGGIERRGGGGVGGGEVGGRGGGGVRDIKFGGERELGRNSSKSNTTTTSNNNYFLSPNLKTSLHLKLDNQFPPESVFFDAYFERIHKLSILIHHLGLSKPKLNLQANTQITSNPFDLSYHEPFKSNGKSSIIKSKLGLFKPLEPAKQNQSVILSRNMEILIKNEGDERREEAVWKSLERQKRMFQSGMVKGRFFI